MAIVTITISDGVDEQGEPNVGLQMTSEPPFANPFNPSMAAATLTHAQTMAAELMWALIEDSLPGADSHVTALTPGGAADDSPG